MGYLLSQMFLYMLAALLLGLFLGWLIWGRSGDDAAAMRAERDRLKGDLDACGRARGDLERRLREAEANAANERARLTGEIDAAAKARAESEAKAAAKPAETKAVAAAAPVALMAAPARKVPAVAKPEKKTEAKPAAAKPVAAKAPAPAKAEAKPVAAKPAVKPSATAAKPAATAKPAAAAKPAAPDDLRKILGIGKVNEKKLHGAGVTAFAQIAAWTDADIKRMDGVIEFNERIVKEKWVEQAKLLAKGDMDAFYKAFPAAKGEGNT